MSILARLNNALVFGGVLLAALASPAAAQDSAQPRLVTFGPSALISEGDHDHRQLVRIEVPGGAGEVGIRVFDADAGGTHDETMGASDTTTRFSLYGEGAKGRLTRTAGGVVEESVDDTPIETKEFGLDAEADDRWTTLFSVNTAKGASVEGGHRSFLLLVEGVSGNDGNVFDVAVSAAGKPDTPLDGARLSSFVPTFQVPHGGRLAELGFDIPDGTTELVAENFDAAGGSILFAGRFRSQALTPSGKSDWRRDTVTLEAAEPGERASLTAANGGETPNDMTLFLSARKAGAEPGGEPVAFDLPINVLAPSRRPAISLTAIPQACGVMRFDASGSSDPEGGPLTHRWRFDDDGEVQEGAKIEQRFAAFGLHKARLESVNGSGLIGNGRARDIAFLVKEPPVARFEAPPLVAEGAELTLDASASTAPALPEGNRIAAYRWSLGDGTEVVQRAGDQQFGKLTHRFASHGVYTVRLTLLDSADNPCNSATTTQTITVNAAPVANAGGDRSLAVGEIASFDAGRSNDPDGSIVSYVWDFGDGSRAEGPARKHTYHKPGSYTVQLTVLDDSPFETGKGIDTVTINVRHADNTRPTADAGPDRTVEVGERVRFDGSRSKDPDGEIVGYAWDFGDGQGSDMPLVEHAYWQPGSYPVSLSVSGRSTVTNDDAIDSAVITVTPAKNRPPVATVPQEFSTTTFRPLRLDASKADDRDGSIVAYDWVFGDGTTGSGPLVDHAYAKPGTYEAKLTLTDNGVPEPARIDLPFRVLVANRPNLLPAAISGQDRAARVGDIVPFDASASRDPDGSILSYRWDLGDGNRAQGVTSQHVYQFPGTYKVRLEIGDDGPAETLTAADELTVVVAARDNVAPVADAGGAIAARTGEIIQFDGSASSDPDGNILTYAWEFGDGGRSPDAKPKHAFHDAGVYRMRLAVTDDGAARTTTTATVEVTVTDAGGAQ